MSPSDEGVLVPGVEILGKYRVERLLGRGGMGEVYLARNQFLDQQVAIKVLPLKRSGEEHWKERMRREAQAGARLAHENLVRVVDGGVTDDNLVYIVMEYLDGAKTLRELVWRSRGFAVDDALAYAIQLLDGLAAVHAAGILHRDLKPENVVVLPGGVVKIIDFGLAKIRTSALRTTVVPEGMRVGTLHYMAPEQIFGGDVGPAADVYAAGLILHEMIAGRHVFQQETDVLPSVQEVSIMHQLARPARLDAGGLRVPKELADVVERMLAKEPAARPSAQEAGAALERVLAAVASGTSAPAKLGVHGTMMLPEGFVPPHPLGPFAPKEAVVTLCARAMERALGAARPDGAGAGGAVWPPPPPAGSGPIGAAPGWATAPRAGSGPVHMPSMPTPSPVTSSADPRPTRAGPVVAGVVVGSLLVAAAVGGTLHLRSRGGVTASPADGSGPVTARPAEAAAPPAEPTTADAPADEVVDAAASGAPAAGPSASPSASASAVAAPDPGVMATPPTSASSGAAAAAPARPAARPLPPPRSGMPGSGL